MFTGLMNNIDQRHLVACQDKLKSIKTSIEQATTERDNFKVALRRLSQIKRCGASSNVVYCNKMWVDLEQVSRLIEKTEARIDDLTRVQYEKYGTKCATLRRRIAARDAKIVGRQLSGSSIV